MNSYDIIDEYGFTYPKIIDKIINTLLEKENVENAVFSIVFVSDEKIKEINKNYRNKDSVTDVISFAFEDSGTLIKGIPRMLGDIFISIPVMKRQANLYEHSETRELSFLVVHGLLHLLGYDHIDKNEEKIMFEKQELILDEFVETRKEKR